MALAGIYGVAVEVGAVELPEVQMRGVVVDRAPAVGGDAFETAVDQHGLGVGIVEAVVVGQACEHRGDWSAPGAESAGAALAGWELQSGSVARGVGWR